MVDKHLFQYFLIINNPKFWMLRLEYKQLDKLRTFLLGVPFVALTATATEKYVPLLLLVNFTVIWY